MTLKDKLEVEIMHLPLTDDVINAIGIELEQRAETFAIGYARFMLGDDAWRADDETLENYKKLIYEQSKK